MRTEFPLSKQTPTVREKEDSGKNCENYPVIFAASNHHCNAINENNENQVERKFAASWLYLARFSSFPEITENAVHSSLEISRNSNQNLSSNGKRP